MGQDPASMERDIEETRAELAHTIDAIVDRVSPKRVAQRSIDQVKERVEARRAESIESGRRLALPAGGAPAGGAYPVGSSQRTVRWDRVALAGGVVVVLLLVRRQVRRRKAAAD